MSNISDSVRKFNLHFNTSNRSTGRFRIKTKYNRNLFEMYL